MEEVTVVSPECGGTPAAFVECFETLGGEGNACSAQPWQQSWQLASSLAIPVNRNYPVNSIYQTPSSQQCDNDAFNAVMQVEQTQRLTGGLTGAEAELPPKKGVLVPIRYAALKTDPPVTFRDSIIEKEAKNQEKKRKLTFKMGGLLIPKNFHHGRKNILVSWNSEKIITTPPVETTWVLTFVSVFKNIALGKKVGLSVVSWRTSGGPMGFQALKWNFLELPEVTRFGKTLEPYVVVRDSLAEETLEENTDMNLSLSCEFFLSMNALQDMRFERKTSIETKLVKLSSSIPQSGFATNSIKFSSSNDSPKSLVTPGGSVAMAAELRAYLKSKGAEISEENAEGGLHVDLAQIIEVCDVCLKEDDKVFYCLWFRLSNLFHGMDKNTPVRYTVYCSLLKVASSCGAIQYIPTELDQVRKWISDWNLGTEKKHTLLRLLYDVLVDCKKREGGEEEKFQKHSSEVYKNKY
ncbi:hypothetical protein llap_13517 [Limosa lapponica baueri]|uniref:Uncharacterized protein n=1 Tax=Limosa lapponica baueri TaxID=1758121 RepID=A0A2I0TQX2_LIMLA|nr:hypothetical protein llap_13517 [Limosa lapponica baueri]